MIKRPDGSRSPILKTGLAKNLMLIEQTYRYTPEMLRRPDTGGIDVVSTLEHFSIITYSLEPERLQALMPEA